jgi:hypothetical protein
MFKRSLLATLLIVALPLLISVDSLAGEGKGKGNGKGKGGDDTPPGFDKGKKKGWQDDYPPGWDKKSDDDKKKWHRDLDDAKVIVIKETERETPKKEEKEKLQEAVERAVRKGKEAKKAAEDVIDKVRKGVNIDVILKGAGD